MRTTEIMDTELLDVLDEKREWFGLTMYGGQFKVEYQGGVVGPFFSVRGAILGFMEHMAAKEAEDLPPPTPAVAPRNDRSWMDGAFMD